MIHPVDTLLALVLLSILFSFGSSRLPGLIKVMAFQGVVVSIVPLFIGHEMTGGGMVFTIATLDPGHRHSRCIYLAIKKVAIAGRWNPLSATMPPSWPACC
jgi:hydrogenase-4 component E